MNAVLPLLEIAPLSFAVAVVLTPLARRVARATRYLDHPDERKAHPGPTPLLGGAAVALAVVAGPALAVALGGTPIRSPHAGIVAGAALSLGLGLLDDRRAMPPLGKLAGQLAVAILLVYWGTRVAPLREHLLLGLGAVVGVAAILNAINFLDAMDGVVSALVPITAGGFVALALLYGASVNLPLAWGLIGACAGFLVFNAPPARIFLGDAGSHVLGFALAALALQALERGPSVAHVAALLVLLAYPLFDLAFVVWNRWFGGRPIHIGGTDHTTHRLGRVCGQWGTLAVITALVTVNTCIAVWLWGRLNGISVIPVVCGTGLGYAIFGLWLGRIRPTP